MRATTLLAAVAFVVAACRRPQNPPGGEPSPPPPPPRPGVRIVDMIPASLSGETWQDAEPFLTIFASNPNILAASAFTPNPGGPASTTAPIYVSDDDGNTWSLRNTLPSNVQTADITRPGRAAHTLRHDPQHPRHRAQRSRDERRPLGHDDDTGRDSARRRPALRPRYPRREHRPALRRHQRLRRAERPHRDRGRLAERGLDV